jgi:tRNA U34 5-methylaminomethyl-2-thiouridine-forming methyltransferase MnmC
MEAKLKLTGDGSHTLFVPEFGEHYHSVFGAIQESQHVFFDAGFIYVVNGKQEIHLLEIGFGTGLNALLTLIKKGDAMVHYAAVEAFPLAAEMTSLLNYPSIFDHPDAETLFRKLHDAPWGDLTAISSTFNLLKIHATLEAFRPGAKKFNLIYFDAFAPEVQPELWTAEVFRKMHTALADGGLLVTYSVKGIVKRALKEAGFMIEKLAGPPGKRQMLRAFKR